MRLISFAPAAMALAIAPLASAQWSETFESYNLNSQLEGQGGWHNWDSVAQGNQPFARVVGTTAGVTPFQGTKMANIVGSQISGNLLADTVHELNGPYSFGTAWTLSTRVYVPSSLIGDSFFIVLDDYNDAGGPYDWAVQIHFQAASASVISDAVSTGNINLNSPATITFDQWVELKVEVDLNNNTGKNYYGGLDLNEYTWTALVGPEVFDAIDLFPGTFDTTSVYYDAYSLTAGIAGLALGTNYCNTNPNSTGNSGRIDAFGSPIASANNVTLTATSLPNNAFLFFLCSTTQAQINNPGGSQGNLCLGGAIGRYVGAGQIQNTGATGSASLALNLTNTPQPTGSVSIAAGQTWNFQAWHRDVVGGGAVSNFTDATTVLFQ